MKNPSRKFIDLIHDASSKWANWDPPNQTIKIGDYGTIDKETGQFEKDGNIYEDLGLATLGVEYPAVISAPEDSMIVSSSSVKCCQLTVAPELQVPGVVDASIKGQWQFGTKRGALLIMARPRISHIPPNVLLKRLIDIPALKDKSLVTGVVSCPAYSLYLSSANEEVIDVELLGTVPCAPNVEAGASVELGWRTQKTTGLSRNACDRSGSYSYTPLYVLKRIRKPGLLRRESPVPEREGDDLWVNSRQPWDPLDEDGEEELFEDTVYD